MKEVRAYIESGILELYVLGQLSAKENVEVEEMIDKYPEIKAELLSIEKALEAYALENAVSPPAYLGDRLLSILDEQLSGEDNVNKRAASDNKVVKLYDGVNEVKIRVLRYSLVACVALLIVSVASLYSLKNKLKTANQQIANLSSEREQFTRTVSKLQFEKAGMENRIAMTETDEWETIRLAGTKNTPSAKMLVYWNKNNKNVLINYAAIDLPKPDDKHEYQLWALVNGKPVSLGVFESNEIATKAVKEMEAIQNAQAFAVTIEPMGGSVNPTMEKMVVMGTI